ncbi:hypothetical protein NTHI1209_00038 [Haemophilus influenzae]|uniref:Uncharacterized protein n=1 Tax=Haemophilus influenzae TaxID=727 RepID=A0A158T0H9_HAEIF|nr:hypothetical protein NTHI1209_00038 [Haemophilus influenzae]
MKFAIKVNQWIQYVTYQDINLPVKSAVKNLNKFLPHFFIKNIL